MPNLAVAGAPYPTPAAAAVSPRLQAPMAWGAPGSLPPLPVPLAELQPILAHEMTAAQLAFASFELLLTASECLGAGVRATLPSRPVAAHVLGQHQRRKAVSFAAFSSATEDGRGAGGASGGVGGMDTGGAAGAAARAGAAAASRRIGQSSVCASPRGSGRRQNSPNAGGRNASGLRQRRRRASVPSRR